MRKAISRDAGQKIDIQIERLRAEEEHAENIWDSRSDDWIASDKGTEELAEIKGFGARIDELDVAHSNLMAFLEGQF